MDYQKQATDFLKSTGTKFTVKYKTYGSMPCDKKGDNRHIFKVSIRNKNGSYTCDFGQSISAGKNEPTAYDLLAGITKYDPGSLENFCGDYGYDIGNAARTYRAVCKEWEKVSAMFTEEEIEQLQEIN